MVIVSDSTQTIIRPHSPLDEIIEQQVDEGMLSPDLREKISFVLLRKHRHQTKKPIHRSLADMGKASGGGARECPSALWSSMAVSSLRHIIVLPKCYICILLIYIKTSNCMPTAQAVLHFH